MEPQAPIEDLENRLSISSDISNTLRPGHKTEDDDDNNNNNNNSSGSNYSGLNLNMTASEMRQLLARRKKFDPKKAQMNIRQKYEIIQQM